MNVPKVTYTETFLMGLRTFTGRAPGGLGEDLMEDPFLSGRVVERVSANAPSRNGDCN